MKECIARQCRGQIHRVCEDNGIEEQREALILGSLVGSGTQRSYLKHKKFF